jgi:ankyrin repeat protein
MNVNFQPMKLSVLTLCGGLLLAAISACSSQQAKLETEEPETATQQAAPAEEPATTPVAVAEETTSEEVATAEADTKDSPLIDATPERLVWGARYGQIDKVRYLLDGGMDVNVADAYGNTALMAAVSNGQSEIVDMLLSRGAKVDAVNKEKLTALMGAAVKGDYELVDKLLKAGAKVNVKNNEGETALFLAVKYGHYNAAKVLLNAGAAPNLTNTIAPNFSNSGFTPLMYAANHGLIYEDVDWAAMATLLLGNGADPNIINSHSQTALDYASYLKDEAVVAALKKGGAKDDTKVYAGMSPDETLLKAAQLGDADKARKVLADDGANPNYADIKNGVTPLLAATYEGHLEVVKLLIENGGEVNNVPSGLRQFAMSKSRAPMSERGMMEAAALGDTALGTAVRQGHVDVAQYLLGKGARLDIPNGQGETPLYVATSEGNLDMVKLLLDHGADPNTVEQDNRLNRLTLVTNSKGRSSVLILAVQKGHADVAKALVDAGANLDYRGNVGKTALYEAVERGRRNLVRLLLEHKADPDITSMAGISPLMQAAQMGNHYIVADLIDSGADVNIIEKPELGYVQETVGTTGMTALLFAARNGQEAVVDLLLKAGAEASIHNSDGNRALEEAVEGGYDGIVKMLKSPGKKKQVTLSTVSE